MRKVEVFTTNVQEATHADRLVVMLQKIFPGSSITFDLDDCDKVLRVESDKVDSGKVIRFLNSKNFRCEILE